MSIVGSMQIPTADAARASSIAWTRASNVGIFELGPGISPTLHKIFPHDLAHSFNNGDAMPTDDQNPGTIGLVAVVDEEGLKCAAP